MKEHKDGVGVCVPPDYRNEWRAFVQKLYIASRGDSSLGSVPSHVLEAARDILLAADGVDLPDGAKR